MEKTELAIAHIRPKASKTSIEMVHPDEKTTIVRAGGEITI